MKNENDFSEYFANGFELWNTHPNTVARIYELTLAPERKIVGTGEWGDSVREVIEYKSHES